MVFIFHEIFIGTFWNEEFAEFFDGMFLYDTFDSGCDGDEWVYFPTVILEYSYEWIIFVVL